MTNTEIKKLVYTSFERFTSNGFRLHNDILYKEPLEDMLVGFCFEKSGFHKNSLYVWSFVQPMYVPSEHLDLTFGKRIRKQEWQIRDNKRLEKDMKKLSSLMDNEVKNFLHKVDTPLKFYNYYQDKCDNIRMIEAVVYSAIYSKSDEAKLVLDNYIKILNSQDLGISWIKKILDEMAYLKEIIYDDDKIEALIKSNVEFTKSQLKL